MGFGVSGASAIIFLGVLIGAVTLYSTVDATQERLDDARDESRERLLDRANTEISITNASWEDGGSNALTVAVENTGATTLSVDATTVLVDNDYRSTASGTVDGDADTDLWEPGETLRLTLSEPSAPTRVSAVTAYGVADATNVTVV